MEEEPLLPLGNIVRRNLAVDCRKWLDATGQTKQYLNRVVFQDNLVLEHQDPGFLDRTRKNFQLAAHSLVFQRIPGFQRIPMEKIGLYQD